MLDYLLDTGPLIRLLRGDEKTREHLARIGAEGNVFISVLTRTEVLCGMRDHESERTRRILDGIPAFAVDSAVADLAGEFMRRFGQRGLSLELTDAIIAATSVRHDLLLVTYNRKDFPMPELRLANTP